MNNYNRILSLLYLLLSSYSLTTRAMNHLVILDSLITQFQKKPQRLDDFRLQYKGRKLPADLSQRDLRGFDFRGCRFTNTNLTGAYLGSTNLTDTTCDYQEAFAQNIKKQQISGGWWYKVYIPKDLKSIALVYPQLKNHAHKVQLLHIASGLSRLPFYGGAEFYIQVQYWSYGLHLLKKTIGPPYSQQLVCSLEHDLENDAEQYCWKSTYTQNPQNRVALSSKSPHHNFKQYLKHYNDGIKKYTRAINVQGFQFYQTQIKKNIESLGEVYLKIKQKEIQEQICHIAYALSRSYQVGGIKFLGHYLFCKYALMKLKAVADVKVKDDIHYHCDALDYFANFCCWSKQ